MSLCEICKTGTLEDVKKHLANGDSYLSAFLSYFISVKKDLGVAIFAACQNHPNGYQIVKHLSSLIDIKTVNERGNTLLHEACLYNNVPLVKYLINLIDPNLLNKEGKSIVDILASNNPANSRLLDFVCLHPNVVIV